MKTLVTLALLLSTTTAIVHAESLEDKEYWKTQNHYAEKRLKSANDGCGTSITIDWVDRDKFKAEAEKAKSPPSGICGEVFDTIGGLCRNSEEAKAAIKSKITVIKCGYSKPRSLALDAGTLTLMSNNEENNFEDFAGKWLKKHL